MACEAKYKDLLMHHNEALAAHRTEMAGYKQEVEGKFQSLLDTEKRAFEESYNGLQSATKLP